MAVVYKNTFLEVQSESGAPEAARRARSLSPEPSVTPVLEFPQLFQRTEKGEYIDPRHPFCGPGPCMHTEGRLNGGQSKRQGKRRRPVMCTYRICMHCHHPDHWDHSRRHPGESWSELVRRRVCEKQEKMRGSSDSANSEASDPLDYA
jgi:hypothetical protein